jgi:hypothetical protein
MLRGQHTVHDVPKESTAHLDSVPNKAHTIHRKESDTMSNNLHAASSEWASRPADERFWTMGEMRAACESIRAGCGTARVPMQSLQARAEGDALVLVGSKDRPAALTHYAFGQLAVTVGAPAAYLRELPVNVAADCLNAGIVKADKSDRDLLFHKNGRLTLRACLSDKYERVWDADVCRYFEKLTDQGWRNPAGRAPAGYKGITRAATSEDILPGQINISVGDAIAPAGLYASDHDMFAFLVAPDRVIDDGTGGTLMRGIFVRNSEVGDASLSVTFFLMQAVCGNHIVWGAKGVHEIRVRHVGSAPLTRALRGFETELRRYLDSAPEEQRMIAAARKLVLGNTKDEVLDAIVKYARGHSLPISRKRADEAYEVCARHEDWYGSPRTLWGQVAGLTHASQASGYADDRAAADRSAGGLLGMVEF